MFLETRFNTWSNFSSNSDHFTTSSLDSTSNTWIFCEFNDSSKFSIGKVSQTLSETSFCFFLSNVSNSVDFSNNITVTKTNRRSIPLCFSSLHVIGRIHHRMTAFILIRMCFCCFACRIRLTKRF